VENGTIKIKSFIEISEDNRLAVQKLNLKLELPKGRRVISDEKDIMPFNWDSRSKRTSKDGKLYIEY
jgi:hypothetical protein